MKSKLASFLDHALVRYRIVVIAIVLTGLMVRIGAAFYWQANLAGSFFRFGDSESYWILARTIADGSSYEYGSPDSKVFRSPLYPLFLAPWTYLIPPGQGVSWSAVMAARIAGCVMGALCIALVSSLAFKLGNSFSKTSQSEQTDAPKLNSLRVAAACSLGAGLLAMLYPGAIGMSVFVLSEAIFCPLILASLWAAWRAISCWSVPHSQKSRYGKWLLVSGAISGAACLARPSWSLWPLFLFPYMLFALPALPNQQAAWMRIKRWAIGCVAFCLGIVVVMSPWWVRNYRVTGKFVPTTLQVGASLYDGWHPGATGSSDEGMEFVQPFLQEQRRADAEWTAAQGPLQGTLEWRLDQRLKNAAIAWGRENSSDAIRLGLVKFIKTWSPLPVARELGSNSVRWLEAIGYTTIMCLAAVGVWRCRRISGAWLYAMPCVYFAVLHIFFIGSVRYRQPSVLVICILGGVGLTVIANWIMDGSIASNNVTADKTSH